ncbi:MAG: L,D-transpeptidase family protein [Bdellovibrionales bacterium]
MIPRVFFCIALLFLSACSSPKAPTSARLESVKARKLTLMQSEVAGKHAALGDPVFIRVFKEENLLEVWMKREDEDRFTLFKDYPVCFYSGTLGPKLYEGDHQAPEGFYTVSADQMNPWSRHNLSFNIGFPNAYDRALGRTGSNIMIHGGCRSVGCFAMTDPAVEDIYLLAEASINSGHPVPVHIFPFRMTEANMARHADNQWASFWQNLKQGYNTFEVTKTLPQIEIQNARYNIIMLHQNKTLF